jgi:hypothetical protein
MAGILLIQIVSGMCWRRPRDCLTDTLSNSHAVEGADDCGNDGCNAGHQRSLTCSNHCQFQCGGVCTFLASENPHSTGPIQIQPFYLANFTLASGETMSAARLAWDRICDASRAKPQLRLHLLNQVILI